MAEPRLKSGSWQIHVSYSFDRLLESKLAQAYDILVPTPMFVSLPAVKSGLGKRKGLSYALCIDLSVVPGFDSRPPKVIPLSAQESGVENGPKTLKTKRKRR